MFGSGTLDTAIGLIFVFLLVSLLVTTINEMISAVLLSRAKWLYRGVDRLLGSEWATALYAHPLIEGSSPTDKVASTDAIRGSGPSYIHSRSFANVLFDLIREGDVTLAKAKRALQDALDATAGASASLDDLKTAVAHVAASVSSPDGKPSSLPRHLTMLLEAFPAANTDLGPWLEKLAATALRIPTTDLPQTQQALTALIVQGRQSPGATDAIRDGLQAIIDAMPYATVAEQLRQDLAAQLKGLKAGYTVGDARAALQKFIDGMPARYLREVVERVQPERLQKTLLVLLDDAEGDVDRFKENVETWFNNAMDRVGGWYKRRSQFVMAAIGMVAAVGLNVDALLIVRHLETHPGVRDALVAQAKAYGENNAAPAAAPKETTAADGPHVDSGSLYSGRLVFDDPAAAAGVVELASSDKDTILTQQSVTVEQGAKDVAFTVNTTSSTSAKDAVIKASGAAQGTATVHIDADLPARFKAVESQLANLGLPIGWVRTNASAIEKTNRQVLPFGSATMLGDAVAFHFVGWLITALAATLGAPFWFDMLNKVISIRSAGRSPEEKQKSPKSVPVPLEPGQTAAEADMVDALKSR